MIDKVCPTCGKGFLATKNMAKYCSRKCFWISMDKKKTARCLQCGKEIKRSPALIKERNFCNLNCKNNYFTKTWTHVCDYCKKEFCVSGCDRKRRLPNKYCSMKCSGKAHRGRSMKMACNSCGKEKLVYFSQLCYKNHYCSKECRIKGSRKHKSPIHFHVTRNYLGIKGKAPEDLSPLVEVGILLYQLKKEIKNARKTNQEHREHQGSLNR